MCSTTYFGFNIFFLRIVCFRDYYFFHVLVSFRYKEVVSRIFHNLDTISSQEYVSTPHFILNEYIDWAWTIHLEWI